MTQAFPTADVLGTITGRLLGDIGGVYAVCEYATNGPVWTHQLPRVGRELQAVMRKATPAFEAAIAESEQVTRDNFREWLATWTARYGDTIAVPRLPESSTVNPLTELVDMVGESRVAVIVTDEKAP